MRLDTPPALRAALAAPGLFLLALLLTAAPAVAQTTLAPGDLAVIGFSSDDDGDDSAAPTPEDDEFALLALVDIEVGTPISITDKGVTADGTLQTDGESVRGFVTKEAISAGEVFTFTRSRTTQTFPSAFGAPESGGSSFGFGLSTSGDQIIVFQENGDGSNTYIYALSTTPFNAAYTAAGASTDTALPPGLSNGTTAVDFEDDENAVDNVYYDRTNGVSGSRASLLGLASNDDNYVQENDGGGFTLAATLGSDAFTFYSVAAVALPVTFEESIDYSLSDFGGTMSVLATDPTDATNTVVQTFRPGTAECFAGTTVGESSLAFEEAIPFTADATTMSVRVWSPEAGVLVLFKVEEQGNPGLNAETFSYTTVAGGWETLVFDFGDPKPNTNPLQIGGNYNKASIFFDFQCNNVPASTLAAADRTYYWDDVAFGDGDGAGMGNAENVVINEVDSDQTDTDAAEFVELYNAGTTTADLSGHALVFFNGSDDLSYDPAFDLDGVTIAAGEYYVICGDAANVANCDMEVGAGTTNLIQNGADAVALVMGDATDFPNDTAAPTSGVIDAIVYGTGDADATGLLAAFGETVQYDEDLNGSKDTESIQRSPDGAATFVVAAPTPGAENALAAPETFMTILLGANEVEPVETDAAGSVMAVLTGTELVVTGRFDDLESDYAAAIGSHLHRGAATENGPVEYPLSPTLDADNRGGTFAADNNTFTVRSTFADSLRNGLVYVNVHTADNNGGEIRGQLVDEVATTELTLRQVRIVGPGYTVTTTGTVSRAAGDFAYIQTEDGGLAVRQQSGELFDDVADGTVQAGTELTVTGTLSEFNGLLQINNTALDSYTVGDTGDAPDPVTVTLADLADNGEFYEGRLVRIADARFADGGGTFALNTSYDVSDTSNMDDIVVRIPSGADDTEVEDTAIPDGPTNIVGVVGEFRGSYQIFLLRTDDLSMGTDGETGPEAQGYTLRVANPATAGAAVTLTAPVAGDVTLELFDTLGRRVATLVDGPVSGTQTARLGGTLASGTYVLRLTTADGTSARTITVVR